MTIKEFYDMTGGDYSDALGRFGNEERVKKYALMFKNDDSFKSLERALRDKDMDTSFRCVHTLKGVCANLSFTKLYEYSRVLTEILRNYDGRNIQNEFDDIKSCYETIINGINSL